jgi:orotate phosphoribosyltransferase
MDIIKELKKNNIIQHGKFILSSGIESSIYIDMKKVISFPKINKEICIELSKKITDTNNIVCGAPYGAISYASIISVLNDMPMIFLRKETKKYGTKKIIEGEYNKGDKVVLIEDVVTTGNSVIEAANMLEEQGLIISQIIAVVSRVSKDLYYKDIKIESLFLGDTMVE